MDVRDELNAFTPRLRRYARALTSGSPAGSELADDLVHATLMRALASRSAAGADDLAIRLYATVTRLNREAAVVGRSAVAAGAGRPALVVSTTADAPGGARHSKMSAALLSLSLENREALLLVTLEGFDYGDAARILRVSRSVLLNRLTQARTALDAFFQARPSAKPRGRDVPYLRLVT